MFFVQRNWSPLCLFLALPLSLLSMLMQTLKFSRKKDLALLLFFLSKSVWPCNLPPKDAGCLKSKISPQLASRGRRTHLPASSIDNQIFLPIGLRCPRESESSAKNNQKLCVDVLMLPLNHFQIPKYNVKIKVKFSDK